MMTSLAQDTRLSDQARTLLPELVDLRRAIHAEPELGLDCARTTEKLKAALAGLPLEIHDSPGSSSFIAILQGTAAGGGRTVLLRGDMDALPMHEATGFSFASQTPGIMHACGHDLHSAMLVGTARLLSAKRDQLGGNVVFMFQAGEEGYHGARLMLEEGLLDICPADWAFALHVTPNQPTGIVACRAGALMASGDRISAVIRGRGGHAAMPHQVLDPIPAACEIVLAVQSHIARRVPVNDPAVLSITQINAGSAGNVIPDEVSLQGSLRTFSETTRAAMCEAFCRIAEGITAAHGLTADVQAGNGFPSCINNSSAVALLREIVQSPDFPATWLEMPDAMTTSEDFSYVLQKIPGAMAILGAAPVGSDPVTNPPPHHVKLDLNEDAMAIGIELLCKAAEQGLNTTSVAN